MARITAILPLFIAVQYVLCFSPSSVEIDQMCNHLLSRQLDRSNEVTWSRDTSKRVTAIALACDSRQSNVTGSDSTSLRHQLNIQLLAELWRDGIAGINIARLAEYVLALTSVCQEVRHFFGIDLLERLLKEQHRVGDFQLAYIELASCVASEQAHSSRLKHIYNIIKSSASSPHTSIDTLSMSFLAMHCVDRRSSAHQLGAMLRQGAETLLANKQSTSDGGFRNLHATILATQALRATGARANTWNESAAMQYIMKRLPGDLSALSADDREISMFDLTQALPVLVGRSLADVAVTSCHHVTPRQEQEIEESTSEEYFLDVDDSSETSLAPSITVTLWLWLGNNVNKSLSQQLIVPANTSVFQCLLIAAERDDNFEFSTTVWPNGHYVYKIGAWGEHKVGYHFWLMYLLNSPPDVASKPDISHISPTGIDATMPTNDQHVLFWFKKI